jgi:hypothetical protein
MIRWQEAIENAAAAAKQADDVYRVDGRKAEVATQRANAWSRIAEALAWREAAVRGVIPPPADIYQH